MSGEPPTQPMSSGPATLADGRYRLHLRLGAGGMGVVAQATDTLLGREVAVKLLADNLAADETARGRFLGEARSAARISDPHVVAVHDVGEEAGRPYLVMELVGGPSLADVVAREGPLHPEDVMGAAAEALAGLDAAHEAGLLHRDVKPGNLLRTPGGRIKITDFGVAKAADTPELTRGGMVIGTGPYLAPERRRGEPASPATDLYALGVTLLELLTGHQPAGPDDLPSVPEGLPWPLVRLLEDLLAEDPRRRPSSAQAALHVLAGVIEAPDEGPPTEAAVDETVRLDREAVTPSSGEDPAPTGLATRQLDAAGAAEPRRSHAPSLSWPLVVLAAVVLLAVAVGFRAIGGTDAPDAPAGVERTEEPAETARNLAEWLQDRAGQ